jgi:neutral trehalase
MFYALATNKVRAPGLRFTHTLSDIESLNHAALEEKYDVVKQSVVVQGTLRYGYRTNEAGFGWTNASYQVGLALLPEDLRRRLDQLIPPEWIFRE